MRRGEQAIFPLNPPAEGSRVEKEVLLFSKPITLRGKPLCTIYLNVDLTVRNAQFNSYMKIALAVLFGSLFRRFFYFHDLRKKHIAADTEPG